MATSLTNNVLTFNTGSIRDVRNDLGIAFPLSLNASRTFTWSSASSDTVTVSGNPGQVVFAAGRAYNANISISSNGGVWYYYLIYGTGDTPSNVSFKMSLPEYPWEVSNEYISVGSISFSSKYSSKYWAAAVIAYRLY